MQKLESYLMTAGELRSGDRILESFLMRDGLGLLEVEAVAENGSRLIDVTIRDNGRRAWGPDNPLHLRPDAELQVFRPIDSTPETRYPAALDLTAYRKVLAEAGRWATVAPERRTNDFESMLAQLVFASRLMLEALEARNQFVQGIPPDTVAACHGCGQVVVLKAMQVLAAPEVLEDPWPRLYGRCCIVEPGTEEQHRQAIEARRMAKREALNATIQASGGLSHGSVTRLRHWLRKAMAENETLGTILSDVVNELPPVVCDVHKPGEPCEYRDGKKP